MYAHCRSRARVRERKLYAVYKQFVCVGLGFYFVKHGVVRFSVVLPGNIFAVDSQLVAVFSLRRPFHDAAKVELSDSKLVRVAIIIGVVGVEEGNYGVVRACVCKARYNVVRAAYKRFAFGFARKRNGEILNLSVVNKVFVARPAYFNGSGNYSVVAGGFKVFGKIKLVAYDARRVNVNVGHCAGNVEVYARTVVAEVVSSGRLFFAVIHERKQLFAFDFYRDVVAVFVGVGPSYVAYKYPVDNKHTLGFTQLEVVVNKFGAVKHGVRVVRAHLLGCAADYKVKRNSSAIKHSERSRRRRQVLVTVEIPPEVVIPRVSGRVGLHIFRRPSYRTVAKF